MTEPNNVVDDPIEAAALRLQSGQLVAFPTETVYGLGARADDDQAVGRIFAAKGRPADHPLIVHVASLAAAQTFAAYLSPAALRLVDAFWPGPLTIIVPRRSGMAKAAAGGQDSVGLRMPAHPLALAWLQRAGQLGVAGVAGPSANRFGRVSPTTAEHVRQEFGPDLMVLDGGACTVGIESAIVDCTRLQPALLRPGQLTRQQLEDVLGQTLAAPDATSPRASGTLESHYAPSVPVRMWATDDLAARLRRPPQPGEEVAVYSRLFPPAGLGWRHQPMAGQSAQVAHDLFAVLRDLDQPGVAAIWVEHPPADAEWDGVRDRLQRASA